MLAIDGFCGKRYNAESDGEIKSAVPIIITVGKADKAFSSGPVNGGVRIRNKNQVIWNVPLLSIYLRIYKVIILCYFPKKGNIYLKKYINFYIQRGYYI